MILPNIKYSYSDLAIVPPITTEIKSRSECNPFYQNKKLPIFTAPMEGVCNDKNYQVFEREGITPIIHRNVPLEKRLELLDLSKWCAYSIKEFKGIFLYDEYKFIPNKTYYALIDVANGHMQQIFDLAKLAKQYAKQKGYKLVLMAGNIANPYTYSNYCDAEIDYVRCSIGTGSQCLTSANTAIHYPNASLIQEIYEQKCFLKKHLPFVTKIIADGGMGNTEEAYSRSIIALALGADYVMIGGAFSSFIESAAKLKGYYNNSNNIGFDLFCNYDNAYGRINTKREYLISKNCKQDFNDGNVIDIKWEQIYNDTELAQFIVDNFRLQKESFGMSSKQAQENNPNFDGNYKTSEGKSIISDVKYTCHGWVQNFIAYLKSTMSYCNARTLDDFIGKQTLVIKSSGTHFTVNK